MRQIDELYIRCPFYGTRKVCEQFAINRKRAQRLMRLMGLEGVRRRRSTSRPAPGHKVYPYLLRDIAITRPDQAWASDITYIPLQHGFLYLTAVMDIYSRNVLSWRLSNTLAGDFCIEALDMALSQSQPEIFNTDQGAQFTSVAFTSRLEKSGVAISMDGRGRALDNVFVERLWRSLKYEEVGLLAGLRRRLAGRGLVGQVLRLLLQRAAPPVPCLPHTRRGLRRGLTRQKCSRSNLR